MVVFTCGFLLVLQLHLTHTWTVAINITCHCCCCIIHSSRRQKYKPTITFVVLTIHTWLVLCVIVLCCFLMSACRPPWMWGINLNCCPSDLDMCWFGDWCNIILLFRCQNKSRKNTWSLAEVSCIPSVHIIPILQLMSCLIFDEYIKIHALHWLVGSMWSVCHV